MPAAAVRENPNEAPPPYAVSPRKTADRVNTKRMDAQTAGHHLLGTRCDESLQTQSRWACALLSLHCRR